MIAVIVLYDTRSCRQQESSSNGEACVACAVDGQNHCIKILQPSYTTSQLKGKIQRKFLSRDFSDINLQGHGSPGHGSQWACPQGIRLQRHGSPNGMGLQGQVSREGHGSHCLKRGPRKWQTEPTQLTERTKRGRGAPRRATARTIVKGETEPAQATRRSKPT